MNASTKWEIITILGMKSYGYKIALIANYFNKTESEIEDIIERYTYNADV